MQSQNSILLDVGGFFNQKLEPTSLKEKFIFAMFQIVAENGADALTASELINKTNSSKGALFHHFKTLDDLCLSSLIYFKTFVKDSIQVGSPQNLLDFLKALALDEGKRKFNSSYFHLAHFFRDRAIRDSRFHIVLKESDDIYAHRALELAMIHLSANLDSDRVKSIMVLYCFALERIYFQGLMSSNILETQKLIEILVESTYAQLQQI